MYSQAPAEGPAAEPMDLCTALQLYMWAIANAHSKFTKHRPRCVETDLIKEVDRSLCRYTNDWHSDPGSNNHNCNITQYCHGLALDGFNLCDHVIPKRRMPTVNQGTCTWPVDTMIGEAKWRPAGRGGLKLADVNQKSAEVEHVRLGFAKCLVWWCARFPSATDLAWSHTEFELSFQKAQDCRDCKQWLQSLGLMLQL